MKKQWFDNNANNAISDKIFTPLTGVTLEGGLFHCCCGVGTRLFGLLPEFIYSV